MTLNEKLTEKKNALVELEPELKSENVSDETIAKGEELVAEIEELEKSIENAEKAATVLNSIGKEEDTTTDDTQEGKKMSSIKEFTEKAKGIDTSVKGWSVATHLETKANTDVVTAPTIADVDRYVAPMPTRVSAASLFSNATISGNAITYFLQGAIEGSVGAVAQGAKKNQISTSFEPTTLALSKIAAFIKETDEILDDASFLASEVEDTLIYKVGVAEDSYIVGAIGATSGVLSGTYDGTTVTFADGILGAIKAIKANSAYDASVVIVNPADMLSLMTAKDDNKQYIGGGYFTGAYGNGTYGMPTTIWGVTVFESSDVSQGSAIIAARPAVKIWKKGGLDVKLYEQNEDDAIYNRVTLLAEERLACAVVDLNGVYILTQES